MPQGRQQRPLPGLPQPRNFAHPEFTCFTTKAKKLFTKWQAATVPQFKGLAKDGHPKPVIAGLAEDLLATFKTAPILDAYRRLSAPDGLLGGDPAGRLLPHRRCGVEGGRETE